MTNCCLPTTLFYAPPRLKVAVVTANVVLEAVVGVNLSDLSDCLQDVGNGLVEELVDRTLNEDVLLRVLLGTKMPGSKCKDIRGTYEGLE